VPVLVAVMVGLWVVNPRTDWPSQSLLWLLAYGPTALAIVYIVIPAARNFLASGQPRVLMLGCGMWVISLGVIGGASVASRSLDMNWAIYDSAFLLSALCHLAGVAISTRQRIRPADAPAWLAVSYAGGLAVVGLFVWGALKGWMPTFYVAGQGGTLLRGLMLVVAVALFVLTAGLLWKAHRRAPSPFLYWYALGLALIAAGLAGSMFITSVNSPLQWTTRTVRTLGTVYLCVAVMVSAVGPKSGWFPLEGVGAPMAAAFKRRTALGWALRYLLAVALVAGSFGARFALTSWFGPGLPPYILVYPGVAAASVLGGLGPGVVATVLSGILVEYWLLAPIGQFAVASSVDRLGLVIFFGMGLFLSAGAELYRRYKQKAAAFDREEALRESQREKLCAAEAAQAAHGRLYAALSFLTFAAVLVTEDDRVDFANQAFCDMFHLRDAPADLRSLTSAELLARINPAYLDSDQELARIGDIVKQGRLVQDEQVRMQGGRVFLRDFIPLRLGDADHGRLWIHKDITDRRRAEEASRESLSRLEAIFSAMPYVIVEYDLSGAIVRANEAALKVAGFSELDFTYRKAIGALKFRHLDGRPLDPATSPTARAMRGEIVAAEPYAITTADGRDRIISTYAAPLYKDRAITGVVALWHDITELKKAEAVLKEEADRKDQFLALLGHELRNPLVPIRNAIYLVRRAGRDPALLDSACTIAEHQVAHIARLVDDLLDVSRIARGKVQLKSEAVDLVQVIQGVVRDYQPVFAENELALEASLPSTPVRVHADPARLVQMVSNLLHNAIKFTDPGGKVSLSVDVQDGAWAQVAVRDSGAGIPAEMLSSVFEPFIQSRETIGRTRGGLGLGLALAKGLAELHGGTLSAHSDGSGTGSRFILRLPVLETLERTEPQIPVSPPAPTVRGRRILVVEDLQDAATTLRLLLEMLGHTVETACDGQTGLDQADRFHPEIILCDIGLPGQLDGYGVARAIRRTPGLEKVHLVAMTGFGSTGARDKALEAGFDLHLVKPVEPETLAQVIARLTDR
jgi:PAS domain S-box-containing protein